jgi:four helix bundle protein
MEPIISYRDLHVWKVGMEIAESAYRLTKPFPRDELFGITSQIRRAATSIPANIAEGYGRQRRGDYAYFLRVARGSLKELETHLLLSLRVELTTAASVQPVLDQCEQEGKMLTSLISKLDSSLIRESDSPDYDPSSDTATDTA